MKPSTLTRSLRDLGPSALCSGLVRRFRRVVHHLGELMLSVFGKTIRAGEDEHGVAAAIGVAIYPLDAEGGVEFERRAGIARYCETAGKSAVCYCEAHTGTIRRTARPERAGLRRRTAFRRRKCAMD
jgi:predicted signal transduction protein with EAL and GGDEF domain